MSNNSEYVNTNTLDSTFNNNKKLIMRKKHRIKLVESTHFMRYKLTLFFLILSMSNNSEYLNTNTLDGIAK